jgi:broad specificity phosphatase PhoE
LPIDGSDALAEGARLKEVLLLVREVASSGDAVLSTHGDVIELLLGHLQRSGVTLVAPPGRVELAKGSTWVLEATADGDVVEGRYVPPP